MGADYSRQVVRLTTRGYYDVNARQIQRFNAISTEEKALAHLHQNAGSDFPGSDYHPDDRKNWMSGLNPDKIRIHQIVWPGTHDSATNEIGIPLVTRPFGECQYLSIYEQLKTGARVLDIRVQQDRRVCHGILLSYGVDVVIDDVRRFLRETRSEIVILEIRTEYGHDDPPDFDRYLKDQLGEYLIHHDEHVFDKTISELLPKRLICVWKPRNTPRPKAGDPLWSSGYLTDNWIDTEMPLTKFESNMKHLAEQPPAANRKHFYRVENTVTPQMCAVKVVTDRIRPYARLFISQCFARGSADRLQILSTDFIDEDFVDACLGLTWARVQGMLEII